MVLSENLMPFMVEFINQDRRDQQKEACWVVCNAVCGGNPTQINSILNVNGVISALCKLIRTGEDDRLVSIVIESLERFLVVGDMIAHQTGCENEVKYMMNDEGVIDALEAFDTGDKTLYNRIETFISNRFGYEE